MTTLYAIVDNLLSLPTFVVLHSLYPPSFEMRKEFYLTLSYSQATPRYFSIGALYGTAASRSLPEASFSLP